MNVTRTFDADAETLDFEMGTGGMYCFDAQRVAGSLTLTLQTSLDGGVSFVNYYGSDGILREITIDATNVHGRFFEAGRQGQQFRVVSSAGTTPDVLGVAGIASIAYQP